MGFPRSERLRLAVFLFAFCSCLAGSTSIARGAEFEIVPGSFVVQLLDSEGHPELRAGAHPDRLQTKFSLTSEGTGPKNFEFRLPAGFAGSPDSVPPCPRELAELEEECPPESRVGTFNLFASGGQELVLPVYQLEPLPGQGLVFGSKPSFDFSLSSELRPDDFGITLKTSDLPEQPIVGGEIDLWGVPADHQVGTAIPRRPLLTAPTRCAALTFEMRARSWQEGAPWLSATTDTPTLEGCEDLRFDPGLSVQLSNPIADSPTGLRMEMTAPREDDASERGEAQIRDVTVAMPAGVGVSPGGAEGLAVCTDAQLDAGRSGEARCPAAARVGEVEFASAAFSEPIAGAVYLGEERPGDRFRLFVVLPVPGGAMKFVGSLAVDPVTGRLSTALRGLPPLALHRIVLSFDGGPTALLATPLTCGPAPALASFESDAGGPAVEAIAPLEIRPRAAGTPCSGAVPFEPRLNVESATQRAGRENAIAVKLLRNDGEQLPRRFSASLPAGMSAALGTLESCSEAAVAAAACPPDSRLGGALGEVGSGTSLAGLRGNVYLTGPYRRAPFGMAIVLHARLGPFDLGSIVLRSAFQVDGRTGRATVLSDPIPSMVEGMPIRFRALAMNLDRKGLIRNPTSCGQRNVDGLLESHAGARVSVAAPFNVTACHRLAFKPEGRMDLDARGADGISSLRVSINLRRRDSNLRSMVLSFPKALKLKGSGVPEICSRADATLGACPAGSRIGAALARTALLSGWLRGSVYAVQPKGNGQPDMGLSLRREGLNVDLTGRTSVEDGHLVARLVALPDVPLLTLEMKLGGANAEVLSLDGSPCHHGKPRRFAAAIVARAQNGVVRRLPAPIRTRANCGRSGGSDARRAPHPPGKAAGAR